MEYPILDPLKPLVAIPSKDGPSFTAGKRYPIVGCEGWNYLVQCNKGHLRAISMRSGDRSAHLPPLGDYRYGFPSEMLGTFEIELAFSS